MSVTFGERRSQLEKDYDAAVLRRVKAGIELLEREIGPEWVERIELETLCLSDSSTCVLGQVYGDFNYGLQELWEDTDHDLTLIEAMHRGFYEPSEDYGELQEIWMAVLEPHVTRA
jgi:hypothetical protein